MPVQLSVPTHLGCQTTRDDTFVRNSIARKAENARQQGVILSCSEWKKMEPVWGTLLRKPAVRTKLSLRDLA